MQLNLQAFIKRFSRSERLLIAVILIVVTLSILNVTNVRSPRTSSETRFVEYSHSGMRIVPASCPSNPHTVFECSAFSEPGEPAQGTCAITASKSTVAPGESVSLIWKSAAQAIDPTYGYYTIGWQSSTLNGVAIGRTGFSEVNPYQTTTYTLYASYLYYPPSNESNGGGQAFNFVRSQMAQVGMSSPYTISCSVTVTVEEPPPVVIPPSTGVTSSPSCTNGLNVAYYPSCSCPPETTQSAGLCVEVVTSAPSCSNGLNPILYPSCACPSGYTQSGQSCVASVCSNGLNIASYPTCTCPLGATQAGSSCIVPATVCGNGLNIYLYPSCVCPRNQVQNGGTCSFPSPSIVRFRAEPSLIRSGATTMVRWETENMSSCSVTENNTAITDTWVGETSATHTSSPIGEQTVYTLRCVGLDSSVETRDAIVNVVPVWQEQ